MPDALGAVRAAAPIMAIALVAACGGGSGSATTAPSLSASSGAEESALSSVEPSAGPSSAGPSSAGSSSSEVRAWPTASNVALEAGRYSAAPPFDVPLTFDVIEGGWESAHLHGEFLDLIRDVGPGGLPARWLAFGRPAYIGVEPGTPATGMSVDEAIALFRSRDDARASEPEPFELDGRAGTRINLHTLAPDTKLFGGEDGAFGQGPNQDIRLGVVEHDGGLLLVLVLAAAPDLDAAWTQVQPILESVDF